MSPKVKQFSWHGERRTPVRLAVLDVLQQTKKPLSIEDIFRLLRRNWNLVTVYRTLEFFVRKGIVRAVQLDDRSSRYELQADHHHHVQCIRCGRLADVPVCVSAPAIAAARKLGFRVQDHRLELLGECLHHSR